MSIFMSLSRFYLHLSISLTAACSSTYEETVLEVKGEPEGKVSRSMPLSLCLSLCLSRFYLHLSISLTAACSSAYEETVLEVKGEPEGKVSRSMPLSLCLSLCLYLVSICIYPPGEPQLAAAPAKK